MTDDLVGRLYRLPPPETDRSLPQECAAEIERLREDAERYYYCRDHFRDSNWTAKFFLLEGAKFDAAIDAARGKR